MLRTSSKAGEDFPRGKTRRLIDGNYPKEYAETSARLKSPVILIKG